jgi:hypothetical protein
MNPTSIEIPFKKSYLKNHKRKGEKKEGMNNIYELIGF